MTAGEKYMLRCIELARLGIGETYPNPMVGCVIVHNGKIIGEGYHQKSGQPHAEVNAIHSVKHRKLLEESTLYVSLEPCSHFGKTPPCSDLIISENIPKVVIGSVDPYAEVAGKGIERLKNAGIEVEVGVLEKECGILNKRFFTYHTGKRPFIILKWAQTQDGFIDINRSRGENGRPTWITNELSRRLVHKTRAEEAAILVGTRTVLKDNPALTVRSWHGENPVRVVLDRNLSLPKTMRIFAPPTKTIVFNSKVDLSEGNILYIQVDFEEALLKQVLATLYSMEIQSLIVEGGAKTLQSFIDAGLWDEAHLYTGPIFFGDGVKAPQLNSTPVYTEVLDNCRLFIFENSHQSQ